jgi:hypothetical protein
MASIRAKVRDRTTRHLVGLSLETVVADLNPVLRGWAAYFRHGNSSQKFGIVNSYVNERLAIFASKKHGLHGRNWGARFNHEWATALGVYRLPRTAYYGSAHALR